MILENMGYILSYVKNPCYNLFSSSYNASYVDKLNDGNTNNFQFTNSIFILYCRDSVQKDEVFIFFEKYVK